MRRNRETRVRHIRHRKQSPGIPALPEKASFESEQIFQVVMEATHESCVLIDHDGTVLLLNRLCAKRLGKPAAKLLGTCVYDHFSPEVAKSRKEQFDKVFATGRPVYFEDARSGKFFEHSCYPVRDRKGVTSEAAIFTLEVTEGKHIETDLQLHSEILENMAEGVSLVRVNDGTIVYVNPSFESMFGYDPGEIIGKQVSILVAAGEKSPEETAQDIIRSLCETDLWTGDIQNIRKNGAVFWCHLKISSFNHYQYGQVWVGISEDITERKLAEEALIESEKRYRLMAENIHDVFWMATPGIDRMLYVSPGYERIWGRTRKSLYESPQSFIEAIHPEDRGRVLDTLKMHRSRGTAWGNTYRIIRPDGSIRWIEDRGFPVQDEKGNRSFNTGIARDITETREAEQALKDSENRYRLLAENVSDVIWTMDTDLNFTYISPSFARLRGITADKALPLSLREVVTPSSYDYALGILREELSREETGAEDSSRSRVLELETLREGGSTGWSEVRVSFLRDAGGRLEGILGIARDVTLRKEAEQELRMKSLNLEEVNTALKVLLEQREKDKNELEEKILFNVKKLILPYVERLKNRRLDEEQKTYLDVVETNLRNIISPFAIRLTSVYANFTPLEIRVADFIRGGKTVKEIARAFGVSESAVNLHRQHIRNKLGLKNQKINLRTYLLSLT